jgi:hypothetical protein
MSEPSSLATTGFAAVLFAAYQFLGAARYGKAFRLKRGVKRRSPLSENHPKWADTAEQGFSVVQGTDGLADEIRATQQLCNLAKLAAAEHTDKATVETEFQEV